MSTQPPLGLDGNEKLMDTRSPCPPPTDRALSTYHEYGLPMAPVDTLKAKRGLLRRMQAGRQDAEPTSVLDGTAASTTSEATDSSNSDEDGDLGCKTLAWSDDEDAALWDCLEGLRVQGL